MWLNNNIGDILVMATQGTESLLDLGCGKGGSSLIQCPVKVGIDGFKGYEKDYVSQTGGIFVHNNIKYVRQYTADKSYDTVILWDVIEHLEKQDGIKLLADIEMIARKQIVVFTPNGMMEQNEDPWGDNNEMQIHKSGWLPEEFIKRFYNVIVFKNYIRLSNQDAIFAHKRVG
jgi:hypothetical protein